VSTQETAFSGQKQASGHPKSSRKIERTTLFTRRMKTPKLRHHKATGQAYVVLNGRYIFFGPYGDPEVTEQYHRTIAEWVASGRQIHAKPEHITVGEVCAAFWTHAQTYYTKDGALTSEIDCYRSAMRPLLKLYSTTKAEEFGPKALKVVRQKMIDLGWCRKTVNKNIGRIRSIFRWAGENEIVSGSLHHSLMTVRGLQKGRSDAKDYELVKPVKMELVEAIEPYVSRQIWAVIQMQLLTAARPTEILKLRPCDIDQTGKIWLYCPVQHKTAHHGFKRTIYIGPKAQEVLSPFLLRPAEAYCFSPAEAEAERRYKMSQKRATPLKYGNVPGSNCCQTPRRPARACYDVASYRHAIIRGIEKAFPAPEHLAQRPDENKKQWQQRLTKKEKAELKAWYKQYHWHPHQLRHNAATFLRKEFGLETARIILGHRSAAITEVYAELDQQKALEAMVRVG